jgi:hypothetical protein
MVDRLTKRTSPKIDSVEAAVAESEAARKIAGAQLNRSREARQQADQAQARALRQLEHDVRQ